MDAATCLASATRETSGGAHETIATSAATCTSRCLTSLVLRELGVRPGRPLPTTNHRPANIELELCQRS